MIIKPITLQILAYGQKGNVTAVRNACADFLKDEDVELEDGMIAEADAAEVAAEIQTALWDSAYTLKKVTKALKAVRCTLPEVNERFALEFVRELKIAKTCVFFASWYSHSDDEDHQLLNVMGELWEDSQER